MDFRSLSPRSAPLLPLALALMAGIALAHCLCWPLWLWVAALGGCSFTAGVVLLQARPKGWTAVPALMAAALLGATLATAGDPLLDGTDWSSDCHGYVTLQARLSETPSPRSRSYKAKAVVERVDGMAADGTITFFFHKDSSAAALRYGDRLLLRCRPDSAARCSYVAAGAYAVVQRDSSSLRAHSERVRLRLLERMRSGPLPDRYLGVAEALTLGWRADIDAGMQQQFRDAGLAHMLAVSGLHVGLLAAAVGVLLFWVGKERKGRIVKGSAQLLAVWLFALLSGAAPSTMRAALMFSLFIVSDILGRRTERLNILAATAIVMLVAKPALLFDIGWQLSFSAVAGILLAKPAIAVWHTRLAKAAAVSTAATVATMPVVVATFHRLPLYSLVANVVVVPAAGIILGLSLLYMLLPCAATAWPVEAVLRFVDGFTGLLQGLPWAVIDNLAATPVQVALLALLALAVLMLARLLPLEDGRD